NANAASGSYTVLDIGNDASVTAAELVVASAATPAAAGANGFMISATLGNLALMTSSTVRLNIDSASGNVAISSTTPSTSSATGALTVAGGVGIGGALAIGGVATFNGWSSYGNNTIYANPATDYFHLRMYNSAAGAVHPQKLFQVDAAGTFHLLNDAFSLSLFNVADNGDTKIASTTAATSPTTGALTVAGGVGVGGALNIGGVITANSVIPHNIGGIGGGNSDINAMTTANASIVTYGSGANWAGYGADGNGALWFRTGISGTPLSTLI